MNGIDITAGSEGPQVIAAAMIFTTLIQFRIVNKQLTTENTIKDLDTAAQLASGLAGRIHNLNMGAPLAPPDDNSDSLDALEGAA